ncbi:HalOD1 output domain-containing protein [Halomicroarcula sp. GCM10025817]|uniref:HalOD1 output domain-containing protein n=1 Tax=Haloarcula TaxID=2237 RepID=UPI0023E80F7E|nr:HalOD1 output domain-containing protein [Halomicroarcula sp. SYNS111]
MMLGQTRVEPIVVGIVDELTQLYECVVEDLPPLQESVDVDALESLVTHAGDDQDLLVQFEYIGTIVSLAGDGSVSVHPQHQ